MFQASKGKLEAVNRISYLTANGPEELGPGSKERKSVLINLATGLGLVVDPADSKQVLARHISKKLGVEWNSACESIGQTITLVGLNLLLEAATEYFEKIEQTQINSYPSPLDEAEAILSVYESFITDKWLGQDAVLQMKNAEFAHWKQTEWQGWYFEFLSLPRLIGAIGGRRRRFLSTDFDFHLQRTWDLKAHSTNQASGKLNSGCPLNDKVSMDELIEKEGLGLIVVNGKAKYDPTFSIWHKLLRGKTGSVRRKLKSEFCPQAIEIFWIANSEMKQRALDAKILKVFKQGKQPDGSPRKIKYQINSTLARQSELFLTELIVGSTN